MRARFIGPGAQVPPRSLVVDCGLVGTATYSHWQGAEATPAELLADTSTAMAVNAARDPARWLSGFDWVVNDHIDADGLLALAMVCDPANALIHAELLIAAAEAGDFSVWPGEAAFQVMLRLHRLIADERGHAGAWEQRVVDAVSTRLPTLIAESQGTDFRVVARRVADQRETFRTDFTITRGRRVIGIAWDERIGHRSDSFGWTGEDDDLPPWVFDGVGTAADFHLLAMTPKARDGTIYWLLAPGHSWARVISRPTVAWPDLSALIDVLQAQERGPGRWVGGGAARAHGFVCQLACTDGDQLRASSLPITTVLPLIDAALASLS